jgi:CheY-like chemotaxis protein
LGGAEMQEIIDWLKKIEYLVSDFYKGAASLFKEDKDFYHFLAQLGDDEMSHYELMDQASEYLQRNEIHIPCDITLDQHTRDHIEKPLKDQYNLVLGRNLSKKQIINFIVEVEFSELNEIFLYVINTMKQFMKNFQYLAAMIQEHENRIEHFIDKLPKESKPDKDMRELPAVWKNKFLIIDDNEALLSLFGKILAMKGEVETANNGQEGLKKIRKHFFTLIISDIDMPIMNGLELYTKAVEEDANLKDRFLFYSGNITSEKERFLKENNLHYLLKPVGLEEFIQAIDDITHKISKHI